MFYCRGQPGDVIDNLIWNAALGKPLQSAAAPARLDFWDDDEHQTGGEIGRATSKAAPPGACQSISG